MPASQLVYPRLPLMRILTQFTVPTGSAGHCHPGTLISPGKVSSIWMLFLTKYSENSQLQENHKTILLIPYVLHKKTFRIICCIVQETSECHSSHPTAVCSLYLFFATGPDCLNVLTVFCLSSYLRSCMNLLGKN